MRVYNFISQQQCSSAGVHESTMAWADVTGYDTHQPPPKSISVGLKHLCIIILLDWVHQKWGQDETEEADIPSSDELLWENKQIISYNKVDYNTLGISVGIYQAQLNICDTKSVWWLISSASSNSNHRFILNKYIRIHAAHSHWLMLYDEHAA